MNLTDTPKWSWSGLHNLSIGGVLAPSDLCTPEHETMHTKLLITKGDSTRDNGSDRKWNAPVTQKESEIVAQRFFQAFDTNLKDNFYATVNKEGLDALEIFNDGSIIGGSSTVAANTVHDLILEIVNSSEKYP